MPKKIQKRDGRIVDFDKSRIVHAIQKAVNATKCENVDVEDIANKVADKVLSMDVPTVEEIQDAVEYTLIATGHVGVAKNYILYRAERTKVRESKSRLMQTLKDITFSDAADSDIKRENANVNGNTAMGTMLKYGSESAKQAYEAFMLNPKHAEAHRRGDIHIHDLDFYGLTTTCTQIDLTKLFTGGFSTGHGTLREPQDIGSYAALACIALQSNQNDQHGGQSLARFDYDMAPGVAKTFAKEYLKALEAGLELVRGCVGAAKLCLEHVKKYDKLVPTLKTSAKFDEALEDLLLTRFHCSSSEASQIVHYSQHTAYQATRRRTYQAMEALIHNLNTMHSRAGAQVPFSSINYGMDTSPEGRLVVTNLLLATEAGLGSGETPIFPIQIFRVKEGVNYKPGDPNYDLFKLSIKVSAKRLFPNFAFVDAPFNLQYYKPGNPDTEIAYMGCRTRVIGNVYDPSREVCTGRGNLSFTSINLPRIAIEAQGSLKRFYCRLDELMDLAMEQLLERLEVQSARKVYNMPFLMGQGVWIDSDRLKADQEVREVLKHGSLSVGFIGLAETLVALIGKHHGEDATAQQLGLQIVSYMRSKLDAAAQQHKLNFTLLATPAEGLSGRFVRLDRAKYGVIPGVTDKEYYTNSFHVPVYYSISAFDKINTEAPYHALTNAGHITYIEMDGDPSNNLEAMEAVVCAMHDAGIGYGSINHPVDRDPICGYNGIIGDTCPKCGRRESTIQFERIRRITGYLVGTVDRWNNAKRAEERDRVKHL